MTITSLKMVQFKRMKNMPYETIAYMECKYSPGTQLDLQHLLNCRVIVAALFKIDIDCNRQSLSPEILEDVTRTVFHGFKYCNTKDIIKKTSANKCKHWKITLVTTILD